jgi:hypothetical protein
VTKNLQLVKKDKVENKHQSTAYRFASTPSTSSLKRSHTLSAIESDTNNNEMINIEKKKTSRVPKNSTTKKMLDQQESDDDGTKELVRIERRKLELLEEDVRINRERLHAEQNIGIQVEKIYQQLSQGHVNLPTFNTAFPPNVQTTQCTSSNLDGNISVSYGDSGLSYLNLN